MSFTSAVNKFAKSLDYRDLPNNWFDTDEIRTIANNLYAEYGYDSPFLQAYLKDNALPVAQPWYHGTRNNVFTEFDPGRNPTGGIAVYLDDSPNVASSYAGNSMEPPVVNTSSYYNELADALNKAVANGDINVTIDGKTILKNINNQAGDSMMAEGDYYYSPSYYNQVWNAFYNKYKDTLAKYNPVFNDLSVNDIMPPNNGRVLQMYARSDSPVILNGNGRDWRYTPEFSVEQYSPAVMDAAQMRNVPIDSNFARAVFDTTQYPDDFIKSVSPSDAVTYGLFKDYGADAVMTRDVQDGGPVAATTLALKNPNQVKSVHNEGTFYPGTNNFNRAVAPLTIGGGAGAAAALSPADAEALERIRAADKPLEEPFIDPIFTIGGLGGGLAAGLVKPTLTSILNYIASDLATSAAMEPASKFLGDVMNSSRNGMYQDYPVYFGE